MPASILDTILGNLDSDKKKNLKLEWEDNNLEKIAEYSKEIASKMFDISCRVGMFETVSWLQGLLNTLNRSGKLFPDLLIDGVIGEKTIEALYRLENGSDRKILHKMLLIRFGSYFLDLAESNPSKKKFIRGWIKAIA